jgi:hypothetical protein
MANRPRLLTALFVIASVRRYARRCEMLIFAPHWKGCSPPTATDFRTIQDGLPSTLAGHSARGMKRLSDFPEACFTTAGRAFTDVAFSCSPALSFYKLGYVPDRRLRKPRKMANPDHLKTLRQGVDAWNAWRNQHPAVAPDLSGRTSARRTSAGYLASAYRRPLPPTP